MKYYIFEIGGWGDLPEDAWDNALEGVVQDSSVPEYVRIDADDDDPDSV